MDRVRTECLDTGRYQACLGRLGRPVSWSALCQRYSLAYTPTLTWWSFRNRFPDNQTPRYLYGPADGNLDPDIRDALAVALERERRDGGLFPLLAPCGQGMDDRPAVPGTSPR